MPIDSGDPTRKTSRQPYCAGMIAGSRNTSEAAAPIAPPIQNEPLMARSVRPRKRAGMNSWMVELTAEYSPPIPAPVRKRNRL